MEEVRLKQRLIGAIVLVALGVIFIPMLLSSDRDMSMPVFGTHVPERPENINNIKHMDIEALKNSEFQPVNPKNIPIMRNQAEPALVKEKDESILGILKEATLPEKDQKPIIEQTVWAVQVGSFTNKSNALGLKEKLARKKIYAFVDRIVKDDKAIYRVRVGPEVSREKAQVVKQMLTKEMKLSGLVVRHP